MKLNERQPLFFGVKNIWFRTTIVFVLLLWALTVVFWMYRNFYLTNPYQPDLQGTAGYGQNSEGEFSTMLVVYSIENLIIMATLLPYSFCRLYWIRPLILQSVFGLWMMMLLVAAMHNSGLYIIHLLGIFGINIIIFVLFVLTIIADLENKKSAQTIPNNQWNNRPNN